MTERDKHVEQFRDLTWFIELLKHGFEHLAHVRGYTDEQFRKFESAIYSLKPVPDVDAHFRLVSDRLFNQPKN